MAKILIIPLIDSAHPVEGDFGLAANQRKGADTLKFNSLLL
jgi:hypothetical protein